MDTKQEIIINAEKLFLKLGIRSVSMDDISRGLGISKKTLYQHFENKDSLVETVIKTHICRDQEEMEIINTASKNALDELKKMSAHVWEEIKNVSPGALYDLQKYYRKSWDILMLEQREHTFECFVKNIERGMKEGLFREDINAAIVAKIYANTNYFLLDQLSDPKPKFKKRELVDELFNYHVHGIATAKGLRLWKKYMALEMA